MGCTKLFAKPDVQVTITVNLQNLCEAVTEIVFSDSKGKLGQRA